MSAPTLSTISPSQGPASGGTSVTVTGTALTTTTAVKFGTANATSFTVLSDTTVVATAPAGSGAVTANATSFTVLSDTTVVATAPAGSGAVQVTAITPSGTSNGLTYTYRSLPTLSSVTPNQGSVAGGTSVSLAGAHFVSATAVRTSLSSIATGTGSSPVAAGVGATVDFTSGFTAVDGTAHETNIAPNSPHTHARRIMTALRSALPSTLRPS